MNAWVEVRQSFLLPQLCPRVRAALAVPDCHKPRAALFYPIHFKKQQTVPGKAKLNCEKKTLCEEKGTEILDKVLSQEGQISLESSISKQTKPVTREPSSACLVPAWGE